MSWYKQSHYEVLLAEYSNHSAAIALLKQHRPYLEMVPSLRRPDESVITIPLPIVRLRQTASAPKERGVVTAAEATFLPCDVAILMCDPEWKIKTGVEIFVFIHRPQEDFSDLLRRWRQIQVLLDKDYEWLMPPATNTSSVRGLTPFILCSLSLPRRQNELNGDCRERVSRLSLKFSPQELRRRQKKTFPKVHQLRGGEGDLPLLPLLSCLTAEVS